MAISNLRHGDTLSKILVTLDISFSSAGFVVNISIRNTQIVAELESQYSTEQGLKWNYLDVTKSN
jgi:hypothetical protein